ncbi:MAG: insulinase family protein [Polyangiaceae bacterium]
MANERRYRVEDDVEGAVSEVLWATAFREHAYKWPTIGWMADIEGFTTEDCQAFYQTFYAPNNATIVVAGDVTYANLLPRIQSAYGALPASELPLEDAPRAGASEERRAELTKPTATEKLAVGYQPGHGRLRPSCTFGARRSAVRRPCELLHQLLVRKLEIERRPRVRGAVPRSGIDGDLPRRCAPA